MSKVCWSRKDLAIAMNPDAEAVPDEMFRAVHTEFDLLLCRPKKDEKGKKLEAARQATPKEYLDLFLDKNRTHLQVAVLGSSGSGKSHLIQWMRLNIPPSPKVRVHTIPKARTSLRSIIEDIIGQLPPGKMEKYRNKLEATAHHVTGPDQQKEFLLNNLATAIRMKDIKNAHDKIEAELITHLPYLFLDPHLRLHFFLPEGKIIEQLAAHIFATPGSYAPTEARRSFSEKDLPKYASHFTKAAQETRNTLDLLSFPGAVPTAIELINKSLDTAISLCLNFTGDSLIEMMNDIRRDLESRGEELILLIEDFARLQGVDNALLQAIITPEDQAGIKLSTLRWAMAVTKGYYESLPDTVHTRMDMIVDMDLPGAENKPFVGKEGLAIFSARYLNAARVGRGRLSDWSDKLAENPSEFHPMPNACDQCELKDSCHTSFGEVDGTGLYPFNSTALWNMALRADSELEEKFNPRSVINNVFKGVLETYDSHLGQGMFPPRQLLNDFGGVLRFSAPDESRLRDLDSTNYDRRVALLELWDGTGKIVNLDQGVHDILNLPLLDIEAELEPLPDPKGPDEPTRPLEDRRLKVIEEWARGKKLPENVAQDLREWIYPLLESAVDWNRLGIHKGTFFRRKGPMKLPAIYFEAQVTADPNDPLRIKIPLHPEDETEFNRVSIALQGLVKCRAKGHWDFDGGQEALALLMDLVEDWSEHLVETIKSIHKPGETWDPATAAMELLTIGGVLSGRSGREGLIEGFNGAFIAWPEESPLLSDVLKELRNLILHNREKLISIVRVWRSATKGGEMGQMINPTDLEPAVQGILKGRFPSQVPPLPDGLTDDYRKLVEVYGRVSRELAMGVEAEARERLEWLEEVEAQLQPSQSGGKLAGALTELKEEIINCALAIPKGTLKKLEIAMDGFQPSGFDRTRKAYMQIRVAKPSEQFRLLAKGSTGVVSQSRGLFADAEALLEAGESAIDGKRSEMGGAAEKVIQNLEEIGKALTQLETTLTEMEAIDAD